MLSTRLVHLIETNGDQIIDRVAAQLRREPELTHGKAIQDYELRGLGEDLLQHLGDWLSAGDGHELAKRYEQLGRQCFQQGIPLHEAFRGMSLLREKMLDVAQEHMISNSSIELYAEEELERRLGRFFDRLSMSLVRGFEDAVRKPLPVQPIH
ncbi:MAG TPA: hypothetical protein VHW09_08480 [Bryobacteraceae bacterium]|jgi:hypothetical protein|nr:hypothetical protein [Bryobacteraceae bacterium]